jgi:hypothetical protein
VCGWRAKARAVTTAEGDEVGYSGVTSPLCAQYTEGSSSVQEHGGIAKIMPRKSNSSNSLQTETFKPHFAGPTLKNRGLNLHLNSSRDM